MCDICHQYNCPSSCPNASDCVIGRCAYCGEAIRDYESTITLEDGRKYHRECLEDMTITDLLDELDIEYESEG